MLPLSHENDFSSTCNSFLEEKHKNKHVCRSLGRSTKITAKYLRQHLICGLSVLHREFDGSIDVSAPFLGTN